MRSWCAAAVVLMLCPAGRLSAAVEGEIISEITAQRHGLTRPWLTQFHMDRSRGRVRDVVLYEGVLYAQTTTAMIHAVDAETGQSLWAKQVGRSDHPSMAPAVWRDLLATVNGSRLYVVNRYTGESVFETQVEGAPGAGPALSSFYAYVPMVNGMVLAYRLEPLTDPLKELGKINTEEMTDEEKAAQEKAEEEERRQNIRIRQDYVPPLGSQSAGRALVQPLVTMQNPSEEFVAWATDRGYLTVGRIDRRQKDVLATKYRLQTGEAIAAPATYLPPDPNVVGDSGTIFTASRDGYVYAVLEKNGDLLWKFSAAEPMVEPAVVVDNRVYAATQLGGMYCLDAKNGKQLWWTPQILRFLAASKQRVYAADKLGRVAVLDAKTGGRIDLLAAELLPVRVTNASTDRLYLGTDMGLMQCLREIEQVKPILYCEERKFKDDDKLPTPAAKVKDAAKPAENEAGEKPAAKPRAAAPAGERPVVKERPPPREKAPPKERVPRAKKGKPGLEDVDAFGGDNGGGADNGGKAGKTRTPRAPAKARGKGKQPAGGDAPAGGGDNPFG